jgi:cupin 2 domain-containing protein
MNNLFSDVPADFPDDFFDTILDNDSVRIERIVSHGHASATDLLV